MTWKDLLVIKLTDQFSVDIHVSWPVITIVVIAAAVLIYRSWNRWGTWSAVEAEVALGNMGKVTIRPNNVIFTNNAIDVFGVIAFHLAQ